MRELTSSPARFARDFNATVPGAYRRMTPEDIRVLSDCGLVGRYGYYGQEDIRTIIGLLDYEQYLKKQEKKAETMTADGQRLCKMCRQPLPPEPEGKKGRHREYCDKCEPYRSTERWRRHRRRKQVAL